MYEGEFLLVLLFYVLTYSDNASTAIPHIKSRYHILSLLSMHFSLHRIHFIHHERPSMPFIPCNHYPDARAMQETCRIKVDNFDPQQIYNSASSNLLTLTSEPR